MRYIAYMLVALVLLGTVTGCARVKRVANDVDWVIFDGEPSKDN